MQIKNGKDFWAGLMFIGFGLAFVLIARNYPMGSAVRMGPAYFPTVLGGMLAVLGAMVFFRAFVSKFNEPLKVFLFRPLLLVGSAVVGAGTYFAESQLKGAPMVQAALAGVSLLLFFGSFGPRSMFLVLLSVVIFGYALKPLGLVLSTVILIALSAVGGHDFRKKEIVILTVVMVLFGVLVFVKGLGLPFNLWPGE
ncbi:MAG: tripartite tricarboxylate transporter TctB family protein [Proteobacteria bacterium]|nr:tripartite tricarboxylate transporter TctB family protein [Pseudomonadota bacterium]